MALPTMKLANRSKVYTSVSIVFDNRENCKTMSTKSERICVHGCNLTSDCVCQVTCESSDVLICLIVGAHVKYTCIDLSRLKGSVWFWGQKVREACSHRASSVGHCSSSISSKYGWCFANANPGLL